MMMPKKDRVAVYSHLFKEGVLAVQKNVKLPKHHILNVPNLHVVMAMLSLKSRGHVKEIFNWQWHYFFLTDDGIEYLRTYLHLPGDIVPATLKKPAAKPGAAVPEERRPGGFGQRDDRPREGGYRRDGDGARPGGFAARQ